MCENTYFYFFTFVNFFHFFQFCHFWFFKTELFYPICFSRNMRKWQNWQNWTFLKNPKKHVFKTPRETRANALANMWNNMRKRVRERVWTVLTSCELYLMIQGLGGLCVKRKVSHLHGLTKRENIYVRGATKLFLVHANLYFFTFFTFFSLVSLFTFVHLLRKVIGTDFKNVQNLSSYFCEKEVQMGVKWVANEGVSSAQTRARNTFWSRHFSLLFGFVISACFVLTLITFLCFWT